MCVCVLSSTRAEVRGPPSAMWILGVELKLLDFLSHLVVLLDPVDWTSKPAFLMPNPSVMSVPLLSSRSLSL